MYAKDLLKGRAAIVTGSGTGIGKAVALAFARHGAELVLAARNVERLEKTAEEIRALGGRARTIGTDVADPKEVRAMVEACGKEYGKVDILVNNAAANFIRPSNMLTAVRWKKVIDIVLNGTFYGCLEAGKVMLRQGSGTIVNMVATYAWTGAPGLAPSASAKAGVVALTRSLGVEWASSGVRVNALAPGFVDTPQSRENLWPTEDIRKKMLRSVPMGRFQTLEEVVRHTLFLSSSLSAYMNGEVVVADGGQCLGKGALDMMDSVRAVRSREAK